VRCTITPDRDRVARSRYLALEEHQPMYPIISPEDLIVLLLQRFRNSDYQNDAIYNALLGVLKVQGPTLDFLYLNRICQDEKAYQMALADAGAVRYPQIFL
jgi:hypothetical protein